MTLNHKDYSKLSAAEIVAQVKAGDISARDVTEAALARMALAEPHIHAYCHPAPDLARAMADAVDAKIAAGEDPGPLAGVPVGIKDLVATKDLPTVMGSKYYLGFMPEDDDISVARLRKAGAVILGKTNVPEFGYSGVGHNPVFETARNPWNLAMTPGGSSAGSAASVVAGVSPFAIASDGGGSIRIPASLSGLVGFKASMGRVPLWPGCRDPRFPGLSGWESLEHIGPVARTVKDAALMLSVISGPDMRDRHTIPQDFDWMEAYEEPLPRGLKIAFSEDFGFLAVDPEVRRLVREAAFAYAEAIGATLTEVDPGHRNPRDAFTALIMAESDLKGMRAMLSGHPEYMSPHLAAMISRDWTAEDFTNANMVRKEVVEAHWKLMSQYDLLISPTLAVPAFPVHMQGPEKIDGQMVSGFTWSGFCQPFNFTGQPAVSLPAGLTKEALPVGLQIVGPHLGDALVLRAARAFEEARPWAHLSAPLVDMLDLA
ncbi:amidase [Falsigemmobacter faecalis]|uniref:Amidase n=1 Tax=Falsigemmobacter faecalis TaxID=2488730 RepID=A0A3P3DDJ7_9RHOB|nr:amidase family protein [Falsigemmobacter faecalis]RRH72395.1 amidase [Falsigemmobacter faecalis]